MADGVLGLLFEIAENPSKGEAALQGDNYKLLQKYCAQELATLTKNVRAAIAEGAGKIPTYLTASSMRERKLQ
jgi:hypothetical protein